MLAVTSGKLRRLAAGGLPHAFQAKHHRTSMMTPRRLGDMLKRPHLRTSGSPGQAPSLRARRRSPARVVAGLTAGAVTAGLTGLMAIPAACGAPGCAVDYSVTNQWAGG